MIVPLDAGGGEALEEVRGRLRGRRGAALVIEYLSQSIAAGAPVPGRGPAMLAPSTTGPLVREGQRHLAWPQMPRPGRSTGAKRPTWAAGQPEWTDGGVVRSSRLRCANCEKPLEEDQRIFCSSHCYDALHARRRRLDDAEAARAMQRLNLLSSHG